MIPKEIQRVLPIEIVFGEGKAIEVGEYARKLGRKPLVVIGGGSVKKSGALDKVEDSLSRVGLNFALHEGVHHDPTLEDVVAIVWAIRDGLHDCVIALGGGSVIDASKIAARDVRNRPLIAIPTTAGTGSEVNKHAFLVDSERKRKFPKSDMALMAKTAILDPELTYSMPPELTCATGLDALTHLIEGYFNQRDRQTVNPLALENIPIVMEHLRRAYKDGNDKEARREMMKASARAGVVIHFKPTGLPHGFSYSMYEELAHGNAVAVLLPYCWAYYVPEIGEKSIQVAKALGVRVDGMTPRQSAQAGILKLFELYDELNHPKRLKDVRGMIEEKLRDSAIALSRDFDKLDASPRKPPVGKEAEVMLKIAESAWEGDFENLFDL